jgi:hypothetical protein
MRVIFEDPGAVDGGRLPNVEMDCVPRREDMVDFGVDRYSVRRVVYTPLEGTAHVYIFKLG